MTLDEATIETIARRTAEIVAEHQVVERPAAALLDAEAAGALLDVPSTWLLQEARADRVPHVRFGRYVRFAPDDLEAWWRATASRGPKAAAA